jgi:hypothetical protein
MECTNRRLTTRTRAFNQDIKIPDAMFLSSIPGSFRSDLRRKRRALA